MPIDYFSRRKYPLIMFRVGSIAFVFVALLLLANCKKESDNSCPFLAPGVVYVGMTQSQTDTFVIRRFEKSSGFAKLVDTMLITKAHINQVAVGKDSFMLLPDNYPNFNALFYSNNWQIYFPKMHRTVQIFGAVPRFTQNNQNSSQCQSYVSEVTVDNTVFHFNSWFDSQYRIYVTK
ncbi:MAG: hypothetical protein JST52_07240 [Bacteroidetes bacterium]|nr:hypothetical protein [Bacteroidota bacterium]